MSLLEEIALMGTKVVRLTGGEPFCSKHLPQLVEFAQTLDLNLSVITNGSFIYQYIHSGHCFVPIGRLFLSIDSPLASIHDQIRGIPCLDLIEKSLEFLPSHTDIIVNTVVSRLNRETVTHLPRWMAEREIGLINVIPMKNALYELETQDLKAITTSIWEECEKYRINHFLETYKRGIRCRECTKVLSNGNLSGCMIGQMVMFVDVDGYAYPCNSSSYRFAHLEFGNVFDSGIEAVWKSQAARIIRNRLSQDVSLDCKKVCDFSNRLVNSCLSES